MNQVIAIIDTLERMTGIQQVTGADRAELLQMYHDIMGISSDQEAFAENSAKTIEMAQSGSLDAAGVREWAMYASSVFAAFLAGSVYENKAGFSADEVKHVMAYFRRGDFHQHVKALGLYSCALTFNVSDPMLCYEVTKEAFTMAPDLAHVIDIDYLYEGIAASGYITERCPFCGGSDVTPHYCSAQLMVMKETRTRNYPPAKLWMRCESCNNYYTYDFPLDGVGEINGHYTEESTGGVLKNTYTLDNYNSIFGRIGTMTSGKDYLEIGIGTGEMMAVAMEFGYHVDAVEICEEDCRRVSAGLGVEIQCCDIVDYETDKKYDVIIMGDVFEHVSRPMQVLEKVSGMLKDEGVLWLATPNYNCAYARMQKFHHAMWHAVNHYTYVSYESLLELLKPLRMQVEHYDMSSRYIGSMELYITKVRQAKRDDSA